MHKNIVLLGSKERFFLPRLSIAVDVSRILPQVKILRLLFVNQVKSVEHPPNYRGRQSFLIVIITDQRHKTKNAVSSFKFQFTKLRYEYVDRFDTRLVLNNSFRS